MKLEFEVNEIGEITRNKTIELYTNVGDTVYFIEFPKSANTSNTDKPYIQKAKVFKIEYTNNKGLERFRVDFEYTDKFGYEVKKFELWEDGYLYTSEQEALQKLQKLGEKYE